MPTSLKFRKRRSPSPAKPVVPMLIVARPSSLAKSDTTRLKSTCVANVPPVFPGPDASYPRVVVTSTIGSRFSLQPSPELQNTTKDHFARMDHICAVSDCTQLVYRSLKSRSFRQSRAIPKVIRKTCPRSRHDLSTPVQECSGPAMAANIQSEPSDHGMTGVPVKSAVGHGLACPPPRPPELTCASVSPGFSEWCRTPQSLRCTSSVLGVHDSGLGDLHVRKPVILKSHPVVEQFPRHSKQCLRVSFVPGQVD